MTITLIAALAKNGTIGDDGELPFYCPEDLKWFKQNTRDKTVIMGRKTYESIGHALPKRVNIVVTRGPVENETIAQYRDVITMPSPAMAIHLASIENEDVFIIGGGEMYQQTIDLADRLLITHFDQEHPGQCRFPDIDPEEWDQRLVKQGSENTTELSYAFYEYTRR